jgi:hypothetical protein
MSRTLFTIACLSAIATSASANPVNDDIRFATTITSLEFTDHLNSRMATTAADDPDCYGRGPTVWYTFVPATSGRVEMNTFSSSYDTTLSVYLGGPGALAQIACNDDTQSLQSRVRFDAVAGLTYYVMAGAYASGTGGDLVLAARVAPIPGLGDVRINRVATLSETTGNLTVTGTVSCAAATTVYMTTQTIQKHGQNASAADGEGVAFRCVGLTAWSIPAAGFGALRQGHALTSVRLQGYDPVGNEWLEYTVVQSVRVRRQ